MAHGPVEGSYIPMVRVVRPTAVNVAARWRGQMLRNGEWVNERGEAIYQALVALGDTPDPAAVAAAIGNKSWTHPRCAITGAELELAIQFFSEYGETITLSPALVKEGARLAALEDRT